MALVVGVDVRSGLLAKEGKNGPHTNSWAIRPDVALETKMNKSCFRLRAGIAVLGLIAFSGCASDATLEEPIDRDVNASQESLVTATPFDPLHPPRANRVPPDSVIELDLENRFDFDLIPQRINGVALDFNRDHRDNGEEPLLLPPGRIRFVFTNSGTISHNLRIEGVRPDGELLDMTSPGATKFLSPGDMWELEIRLWEGEFRLTCAVTNHDARGMSRPMIITEEVAYPSL
ncbi:MAG: hypothetical protein VX800_01570 [Chloroflexota bacterium]|nr:hypothetical protein [Chloroflexota bacterium]